MIVAMMVAIGSRFQENLVAMTAAIPAAIQAATRRAIAAPRAQVDSTELMCATILSPTKVVRPVRLEHMVLVAQVAMGAPRVMQGSMHQTVATAQGSPLIVLATLAKQTRFQPPEGRRRAAPRARHASLASTHRELTATVQVQPEIGCATHVQQTLTNT
jgi:hypothetical protein